MGLKLQSVSGGSVELNAPVTASTYTVTMPTQSGTMMMAENYQPSFKNRIINGAMVIDQRNAGASVAAVSGNYTADRWVYYASQASKFSVQQQGATPAGFSKSLLFTTTTPVSLGSTDYFVFQQPIEGLNVADLAWGTASAATVTLSFWVRSSLTGTFGGAIKGGGSYSYPFSFVINSANTFEYKTVVITGATSGTWATDNSAAITICFGLGVGSTYSGTAGAWASANYLSATGATSVVGTNGATFYITGVQLEKGSTATSFDYRPYGTELALCQRYFNKTWVGGSTPSGWPYGFFNTTGMQGIVSTGNLNGNYAYPVEMRAAPSVTVWDHVAAINNVSRFNPNVANNSGQSGFGSYITQKAFLLNSLSGANASAVGAYIQCESEL